MNKYLLLSIAIILLITGVQANTRLTFQNPNDFIAQADCYATGLGYCQWIENASGGNSYIKTGTSGGVTGYYGLMINPSAYPMTYSAATSLGGSGIVTSAELRDSSSVVLERLTTAGGATGRLEVKMIGTRAYLYDDGVQVAVSAVLTQNPSYIGWGSYVATAQYLYIDDIIWGSDQPLTDTAPDKYIFGMPESGYFLMKDIINPANSGFFRVNTTSANGTPTLIASYEMTSTYGKGNSNNETVYLNNYGGGNYQTYYTGTNYAGTIVWNLTDFFTSTAPYGLYVTTIPGSVTYSDRIPYIGSGASIQFDKNSYAVGETATATVIVSDSYYDLATYSYHVVIQDIYGTKVYDAPISFSTSPHTGTASYTWLSTDTNGVYYGLIYATRLSDSEELLMNYDTCELTSALVVNGFVKNAETTTGISGATVNVTQGVTTNAVISGFNGNYTTTTSAFIANQPTTIVAGRTGYETYQHVFTPLYAGEVQINLTLMPTAPTYTGIALGGIVRSPPYNRTVDSATVTIYKVGIGNYLATTNTAGYYIQNGMPNGTIWDIWGSKTGFSNSSIYQKLVVGI